MADRETFLARIRQRRRHLYHFPVRDPGPEVPMSVLDQDVPVEKMIEHFQRVLEDVGGHVLQIASDTEARDWMLSFVAERRMQRAVVTRDVPIDGFASQLVEAGLTVTMPPHGESITYDAGETFRHACIEADVGITGAAFAMADTGTLVMLASTSTPRIASLLPPVHVAFVRSDQFVPHLTALISRLRSDVWPTDGLPGTMTFITGPSRTGDIEQTLSVGVHGPGEVYVVVL